MTLPSALLSCAALGLQHGVDVDHVAAISDVTSIQRTPLAATRCGLLYATGHAATVGLLGIAFITLKQSVPSTLAGWMQKLIGLTLLILAGYVLSASLMGAGPIGRSTVLANVTGRVRRWMRKEEKPSIRDNGPTSSLSLGVLHGIGAETPTQLTMLMLAANLGGIQNGILALSTFAVGMFVSNMVLTTAATRVFALSRGWPTVSRGLAVLTAGYSCWIGIKLIVA